jgi:hypothetical protein
MADLHFDRTKLGIAVKTLATVAGRFAGDTVADWSLDLLGFFGDYLAGCIPHFPGGLENIGRTLVRVADCLRDERDGYDGAWVPTDAPDALDDIARQLAGYLAAA